MKKIPTSDHLFSDFKCPLFPIEQQHLLPLLPRYDTDIITFERGEVVFRQGDKIRSLHIVLSGALHGLMIVNNGDQIEVDRMGPGTPLAVALIFSSRGAFPVDVEALTDGMLWRIPIESYQAMLQHEVSLLSAFLRVSGDAFFRLTDKLNLISTKSLRSKIALFILTRTSEDSPSFTLQRTRTDLANFLGVQRPSLSRTLTEMQDKGLISVKGKIITVVDRKALRSLD